MKRPQSEIVEATTPTTATTGDLDLDLTSIKRAYKRAKAAYKDDTSNKELKQAKSDAKKALKKAEAAAAKKEPSTVEIKEDDDSVNVKVSESSPDHEKDEESSKEESDVKSGDESADIKSLEQAYQNALSAFKANKTNKDLRRAKTAALRALDTAIASSQPPSTQILTCVDCSQKCIHFTQKNQAKYKQMGWKELPKRCNGCKQKREERLSDDQRRSKLDNINGNGKSMCYAFQRGECQRGVNCKFSHNPEHGGKRSIGGNNNNDDDDDDDETRCDDKDVVGVGANAGKDQEKEGKDDAPLASATEGKDSKVVRKEKSLRKKGKGWRNK